MFEIPWDSLQSYLPRHFMALFSLPNSMLKVFPVSLIFLEGLVQFQILKLARASLFFLTKLALSLVIHSSQTCPSLSFIQVPEGLFVIWTRYECEHWHWYLLELYMHLKCNSINSLTERADETESLHIYKVLDQVQMVKEIKGYGDKAGTGCSATHGDWIERWAWSPELFSFCGCGMSCLWVWWRQVMWCTLRCL